MATVNAVSVQVNNSHDTHVHTWVLAANDDGRPITMPENSDRTIQFDGVFDGATAVCEGSLDGVNWFVLTDPQGNPISKSVASLEAVTELVPHIRAKANGGGGAVAINARLLTKKAR